MSNSIRLNWTSKPGVASQKVYRDDSPLDLDSLPTAIATIGGTENSYLDSNLEDQKTYYYVIEGSDGLSPETLQYTNALEVKTGVGYTPPPPAVTREALIGAVGVSRTSSFSVTSTTTDLSWNTTDFTKGDAILDPTDTTKFVAPTGTSFMIVEATVSVTNFSSAVGVLRIRKNGGEVFRELIRASGRYPHSVSAVIPCSAGDDVTIAVYKTTTGTGATATTKASVRAY